MNIRHFAKTDTLYIELKPGDVTKTRDLDEYTVVECDAAGNLCALTIEHASARALGFPSSASSTSRLRPP
jgi:uncharacterized protein YuzE